MSSQALTGAAVSVTTEWTVVATAALSTSYAGTGARFQLQCDEGSAAEIAACRLMVQDHTSGAWHTWADERDFVGKVFPVLRAQNDSYTPGKPFPIRPNSSAFFVVELSFGGSHTYNTRVEVKSAGGTATVSVYGAVDRNDSTGILSSVLDANSVLYAVTDDTPAALAMATNTLLARAGGNIEALALAEEQLLARLTGGNIAGLTVAASRILGRGSSGTIAALTAAQVLPVIDTVMRWPIASGVYNEFRLGIGGGDSGSGSDLTLTADTMYAVPVYFPTMTIDELGTRIKTAHAGNNVKLGVASCTAAGLPDQTLDSTAALSTASTGAISETGIGLAVTAGRGFLLLQSSTSTAQVQALINSLGQLGRASLTSANPNTYMTASSSYAGGFPTDLTALSWSRQTGTPPMISADS